MSPITGHCIRTALFSAKFESNIFKNQVHKYNEKSVFICMLIVLCGTFVGGDRLGSFYD